VGLEGPDDNLWNNVEGFTTGNNRRKTPLSDHLFDVSFEGARRFWASPQTMLCCSIVLRRWGRSTFEENSERALKDQLENGDRKARCLSVASAGEARGDAQ
jgi:hypothetical protein